MKEKNHGLWEAQHAQQKRSQQAQGLLQHVLWEGRGSWPRDILGPEKRVVQHSASHLRQPERLQLVRLLVLAGQQRGHLPRWDQQQQVDGLVSGRRRHILCSSNPRRHIDTSQTEKKKDRKKTKKESADTSEPVLTKHLGFQGVIHHHAGPCHLGKVPKVHQL